MTISAYYQSVKEIPNNCQENQSYVSTPDAFGEQPSGLTYRHLSLKYTQPCLSPEHSQAPHVIRILPVTEQGLWHPPVDKKSDSIRFGNSSIMGRNKI